MTDTIFIFIVTGCGLAIWLLVIYAIVRFVSLNSHADDFMEQRDWSYTEDFEYDKPETFRDEFDGRR